MVSSDVEYLMRLIGQPWERTGRHCWALTVQIQKDLFGRELPLVFASLPLLDSGKLDVVTRRAWLSKKAEDYGWREVDHPVHGAVVRMHRPDKNITQIDHVGVYFDLDGGVVVHTDNPHGVVADSLVELRAVRNWVPRFFVPIGDAA